ncbi:MAG: type II toxin-antitoxin system PemK/MazF family toxin [Anaerolineae bacterium]|nr:type II toxin-antitoxin system PemK/MazF family toxin [Anaerolineae bacterium]
MTMPQRGEIYWLDFSPATGAEMREPHPALVIQNDVGNQASALTIVAAITSNLRVARLPAEFLPSLAVLPKPSAVHLGHIYSVDQTRLRQRAGQLGAATMRKVDRAIAISLGLLPFVLPEE